MCLSMQAACIIHASSDQTFHRSFPLWLYSDILLFNFVFSVPILKLDLNESN